MDAHLAGGFEFFRQGGGSTQGHIEDDARTDLAVALLTHLRFPRFAPALP